MRRRLVAYFARKRCAWPDDLADDTLNRVARRLEEEGAIVDAPPARYCYIVAKYIFLEHLRRIDQQQTGLAEMNRAGDVDAVTDAPQPSLDCLDRCLARLEAADRDLILEYYRGEQAAKIRHRRLIADRLGVTANAVAIRACRIRDRLEACVKQCMAGRQDAGAR